MLTERAIAHVAGITLAGLGLLALLGSAWIAKRLEELELEEEAGVG